MNYSGPIRIPVLSEQERIAPDWSIDPSPFDWQVMIWGGVNPRNGFEWLPLEFQYFGRFYSRKQIMQKAMDLCEREHRLFWQIREPTDVRFMRSRTPATGEI